MVCSNPKLCSNRLDDSRFVPAENIDVDVPLCEPLNEILGSRSKFVNQTKQSDRFSIERDGKNCSRFLAQFVDGGMFAKVQPSAVPTPQCSPTKFSFETLASDGSDRSQLRDSCRGGSEGVDVLGDGFGDRMGTGLREMVYQRSSVIGEGVEFNNREVPFSERPSLVKENGLGVFGVLDRLDGLISGGKRLCQSNGIKRIRDNAP